MYPLVIFIGVGQSIVLNTGIALIVLLIQLDDNKPYL